MVNQSSKTSEPSDGSSSTNQQSLGDEQEDRGVKNFSIRQIKASVIIHSLITSSLLLTNLGVASLLNNYAEEMGFQWVKELRNSQPLVKQEIKDPEKTFKNEKVLPAQNLQRERINEQLQEVKKRAKSHVNVMIYFYARYFVAVSLATISSILAGVCLFFISKSGWDKTTNRYIVNVFIVASGSAVFFSSMPIIFKLEQNISDNKLLYINYIALENEILSYYVTNEDLNGKKIDSKNFIHYLDKQLAKTNQLALGFDSTQIPRYQDIYKNVQD